MSRIAGAASAFPRHYYDQATIAAALKRIWGTRLPNPDIVDRLHTRTGVDRRHLALPLEAYETLSSFGQANNYWIENALEIGEQALGCALTRAGMSKSALSALFVVSVTGIASPSLDARLINRMGLCPHIKRIPIFGLGCVAGAAGIARAHDYVRAYPGQAAALLSVELCSLTLQRDDLTMANLISSALFGDGGAAVIVAGADREADGPEIVSTRSVFYPGTEHVMGWDISEKGFQIVLSPEVPRMVEQHLAQDIDSFLWEFGLTRDDIGSWILHTGGPKVLKATDEALGLPEGALDKSWECLSRTGNLSSASVLVVLEEVMTGSRPEPGTMSILAAMGPAFCSELVLLRW